MWGLDKFGFNVDNVVSCAERWGRTGLSRIFVQRLWNALKFNASRSISELEKNMWNDDAHKRYHKRWKHLRREWCPSSGFMPIRLCTNCPRYHEIIFLTASRVLMSQLTPIQIQTAASQIFKRFRAFFNAVQNGTKIRETLHDGIGRAWVAWK